MIGLPNGQNGHDEDATEDEGSEEADEEDFLGSRHPSQPRPLRLISIRYKVDRVTRSERSVLGSGR